jgi:hypothetical protein
LKVLEPVLKLVAMFQSDCSALYNDFKNLSVLGPTLLTLGGFNAHKIEYPTNLAKYRFYFMYGGAHAIAYLLVPRYIGDRLPLNIREGIEETICNHYFDDKESSAEKKAQVFQEYNVFRA